MNDLKLSLIVEALDRATAPLRRVGEALNRVKEHTEHLHHSMEKLGLAEFIGAAFFTGAVVEAGHSIFELTDKVAELGEGFLHAGIKAGVSTEQIQTLGFAAKQLGVDQDSLSQVFFRFQTHLANAVAGSKETRAALQLLGIPMRDLKTLSKDPEEAFKRLVDGFTKIQNPTVRAKLAMDLFSRSGYQILPMLTAGREEIEKFQEQLKKAHAVMSKEDAEASEKFIQSKQQMGVAIMGLQMRIGSALIPRLTAAIDKMIDWIESLKDDAVKSFADAVAKLADNLIKLLPHIENVVKAAVDLTNKFLALTNNTKAFKAILIALATVMTAQAAVALAGTAASIAGVGAAALKAIPMLAGLIPEITSFAGAMAAADLAMDANPIGVITLAITALVGAIALLAFNWGSIVKGFKAGWDAAVDGARRFLAGFGKIIKAIVDLMPEWLKSFVGGGVHAVQLSLTPTGPNNHGGRGSAAFNERAAGAATVGLGPPRHGAAPTARAHVHVHLTSDGQTKVKSLSAGPGVDVSVDRGALPAG